MNPVIPVLAAAFVAFAPACIAQSVELRLAAPAPPQSPIVTRGIAEWAKQITADSGNAVTFHIMAGPTLATFENVYDRVLKGVAEWVKSTPNGAGILAGYREEVKKFRSGR